MSQELGEYSCETFFESAAAKKAYIPLPDASYEWAPVLEGGISAENVLIQWPSIYTLWEAQGVKDMVKLKNYRLHEVFGRADAEETESGMSMEYIPLG